MGRLFFWCWVFWLGLLIAVAGMNYVEQPSNNIWMGVLILYSGIGILCTATVQLVRRGG